MIMRIPNASPSGIISNFETKCKDYFHPRVFVYVLRNEIAKIARQNWTFEDVSKPSEALVENLMRISCGLLTCSNYLKPQTVATVFLSFAKLSFVQQDVYRVLCSELDFENANPKSLSLIYNAICKNPKSIQFIPTEFWSQSSHRIESIIHESKPQDNATFVKSIAGILVELKATNDQPSQIVLKNLYIKILQDAANRIEQDEFSAFELTCILQSTIGTKHQDSQFHLQLINKLMSSIGNSPNAIDQTLRVLDILPVPNLSIPNKEKRFIRREIARANKKFVQWSLEQLQEHLESLDERELDTIAAVINRLRVWSSDHFAIKFAQQWQRILPLKPNPQNTIHALGYFLRRYESSVGREIAFQETDVKCSKMASHVSNECGKIGEALLLYAQEHCQDRMLKRINEVVNAVFVCRANRFSLPYSFLEKTPSK
ncbi:hypothetical protein BdWA1_001802 [Babesia duncani]|uniref:Uncharacterized protein n=1 Tax=Babesia duncani TaxID=323732 RepID=A0AAD9UPA0_9APIC|nr:hypothetical protein BdWA1_001802 [Babesia duncani]